MKKYFVVSKIEAPHDGSQYVLVAFKDPKLLSNLDLKEALSCRIMKESVYAANIIEGFFSANKKVVFLLLPIFLTIFLMATSIMTTTVHASNGNDVNRFERSVRIMYKRTNVTQLS
jgi:hypothetical protein